jgi:hypothetical protein
VALYDPILNHPTDLSYPELSGLEKRRMVVRENIRVCPFGFDLTDPGKPEHVNEYEVSSDFFSTLGLELALGHSFSPDDDRIGGYGAQADQ